MVLVGGSKKALITAADTGGTVKLRSRFRCNPPSKPTRGEYHAADRPPWMIFIPENVTIRGALTNKNRSLSAAAFLQAMVRRLLRRHLHVRRCGADVRVDLGL